MRWTPELDAEALRITNEFGLSASQIAEEWTARLHFNPHLTNHQVRHAIDRAKRRQGVTECQKTDQNFRHNVSVTPIQAPNTDSGLPAVTRPIPSPAEQRREPAQCGIIESLAARTHQDVGTVRTPGTVSATAPEMTPIEAPRSDQALDASVGAQSGVRGSRSGPLPIPSPPVPVMRTIVPKGGTLRGVVIADAHVDDLNTPLLDTALAIIKEVRPDFIKVLGDFLSLSAVSHWPRVSADVSKYMTSVGAGNCALDRLQGIAPDSAIDFLEGNHCAWVRQYVGLHPELDGTLSVPLQLRLKERGVRWVPEEQASVESWGVYHHGHHAKSTASAAQFYANIFGPRYSARRVFFGHFHNFNVYQSATGCEAMCCGYLGADSPPYTRGSPTAWAQGLVVQEVSDSLCTSTPVRIVNGRAVYGGRVVSAAA